MKNSNGITLIALVVTIIVLLILAGISISLLAGGDGIFGKVTDAVDENTVSTAKEEMELELAEVLINYYEDVYVNKSCSVNTTKREYVEEKNPRGITESGYQYTIQDGSITIFATETNGLSKNVIGVMDKVATVYWNKVADDPIVNIDADVTNPIKALPKNSRVIIGNADEGIVIEDENGNEWVWVEVPKTEVFTTATNEEEYDNIKNDLIAYVEIYRKGSATQKYDWPDIWFAMDGELVVTANTEGLTNEQKKLNNGCGLTFEEYRTQYNKMLSSVYANGGFWIGRYEVGDATATASNTGRTNGTGAENKAVIRPNQIPYNYLSCEEAQILSGGLSTGGKTSSLIFGIQWDLVCKFLEVKSDLEVADINADSTSWGNYYNSSLTLYRGRYNIGPNKTDDTNKWNLFSLATENYVTYDEATKTSITNSDINYYQLLTTGASENTKKMNIYDFAGNGREFTLQSTGRADNPCAARGGVYNASGAKYTASSCNLTAIGFKNSRFCFRPTMY